MEKHDVDSLIKVFEPHTLYSTVCVNCSNPKMILMRVNHVWYSLCIECGYAWNLTASILETEQLRQKMIEEIPTEKETKE